MNTYMYESLATGILAHASDFIRGTSMMKCLKVLEKTQWFKHKDIVKIQKEKLTALINHAYNNVPYYNKIFKERGLKPYDVRSIKDLSKLPILTRQIVRDNFNNLIAKNYSIQKMIPYSTGGSTGEPLNFYRTKQDFYNWSWAAKLRAWKWAGYEIGCKQAVLEEYFLDIQRMKKLSNKIINFFNRTLILDCLKITETNILRYLSKLEEFDPKIIRGYVTAIYILAKFIEGGKGICNIRPKAIVTEGEKLLDYQRETIQNVFETEVYESYGSHEFSIQASECEEHSGYHIAAENIALEVINNEGEQVVEERGKILVTSLHNYAMPLIRYEIGDIGSLETTNKICPCGRGLPKINSIYGRTADIIVTKSGKTIPGVALPLRVWASPYITQFQIVQESYDKIIIKLVLAIKYSKNEVEKLIVKNLRLYDLIFGSEVNIEIKFVNEIPITRSGKRRIVISKVSSKFPRTRAPK